MADDDLPFRVDVWDDKDSHIEEIIALASDYATAKSAYEEAVKRRPGRFITLREKARVIHKLEEIEGQDPARDRGSASKTYRPRHMTLANQTLHEAYAHLYVGDYFTDTLDLSAHEHCALRLLLLETWVRGPVGNVRLAKVAGLTKDEWQAIKPSVLPLLRGVQPKIAESLKHIRTFDGQRLPSAAWHLVRSIVMERDRYACTYCGSDKQLEGDHVLPLSRGGSNAFVNLTTTCRPCNLSKGAKAVEEWGARRRLRFHRIADLSASKKASRSS